MASYDDTATVSGSVVSINNGADEVGAKSCVVTLPASLDGYSSVDVVQTGRNLFYVENSSLFPRDNNTIVENVGTYTAWAKVKKNTDYYIKKSGNTNRQNVFGCTSVPAVGVTTHMISRIEYATNEYSFNSGEYEYIGFYYSSEASENMMLSTSQSALTPYSAYNGAVYTASLGRTIYGGSVDVVKGEGTDENGKTTLDNTGWTYYPVSGHNTFNKIIPLAIAGGQGYLNGYTFEQVQYIAQQSNKCFYFYASGGNVRVSIRDDDYTSLEEWQAHIDGSELIYPKTPEDFTFSPVEINTRLGDNTMWSKQGNIELTYYKSGYGFTSVTVHKETPDGEPVVQTVKFHRIVYGGQADVVRGICEPKNLFVKDSPNEVDGYFTTTGFSTGNANAKTVYIPIVGGETYTVSKTAGKRFQIATAEVIPSNGASFTGRQANNTATSLTITASANDKYLWAWVFLDGTDTGTLADMLDSVQIEKGSSATEYVPGFTPFTFPPISMSTDEGENTLFANEGASAITYRKAVD